MRFGSAFDPFGGHYTCSGAVPVAEQPDYSGTSPAPHQIGGAVAAHDTPDRVCRGQRLAPAKPSDHWAARGRSWYSGRTSGPQVREPSPCWATSRYRWVAVDGGSS